MAKTRKVSDKEFLAILRENAGLYARTARAIEKQFGESYSRQAVRDRAEKHPKELNDIWEENIDVAEEGLHTLMRSKNESVRLRSIELYLKTKGKNRGYVEKTQVENSGEMTQKIIVDAQTMAEKYAQALVEKLKYSPEQAREIAAQEYSETVH